MGVAHAVKNKPFALSGGVTVFNVGVIDKTGFVGVVVKDVLSENFIFVADQQANFVVFAVRRERGK